MSESEAKPATLAGGTAEVTRNEAAAAAAGERAEANATPAGGGPSAKPPSALELLMQSGSREAIGFVHAGTKRRRSESDAASEPVALASSMQAPPSKKRMGRKGARTGQAAAGDWAHQQVLAFPGDRPPPALPPPSACVGVCAVVALFPHHPLFFHCTHRRDR